MSGGLGISVAAQADGAHANFDLDMLYSSPSIIGTTPEGVVWSKDGSHVAFLWNDEGHTFRDVWTYSIDAGQKTRLTHEAHSISSEQEHPGVSEVIWLDGGNIKVAYVVEGQLYTQEANRERQRIEPEKHDIKRLAVSPNGEFLSFVDEGSLWLRSGDAAASSPALKLVDRGNEKAEVQSYQWSSDSRSIAFQLTDNSPLPVREIHYFANGDAQTDRVSRAFPGDQTARFTVGVAEIESKRVQMLARPDDQHDIWNYGLSEDSKRLFINSSDPLIKEHTVYVYDVASGKSEKFYREFDALRARPDWKVAWAPKDDGLIILTDRDGYLHLYHQKTSGAAPQALTNGNWEIANFFVDRAKGQIYFLANESHPSERQIYRVPISGGELQRVSSDAPGTHQPVFSPDMTHAATLFSNDATPKDLYIVDPEARKTVRVTASPRPEFYQQTWADIRYIEFENHIDGTPLIGRLSLPADYDSSRLYPLIVGSVYSDSVRNQFGGRTSHPTWGLDQYLVAQGYIVLNVNVRGSWGQGRAHNQGIRYGYGVVDIEDLHSGVKHLVEKGYVDPERVGIWGSSYGGLMTLMSLFKKPGVYAAGIAGAPATDVTHAYPAQMWIMGETTGDDQPGRYQNQSAKYHTQGLADPLMIIHGTKDNVVLYSDTLTVVEKLISEEKLFELVTMPGVGHGWDNEGSAQRRFAFKKMVEFFNRYLMPASPD